jgi:hypothetical protein
MDAASAAKPRCALHQELLPGAGVRPPFKVNVQVGTVEIFSVFQGVEAAMNIVVLSGAMLFFLVSPETRMKRRRSLSDLHRFRSIAHVIDMHQLTKDPSTILGCGAPTVSSPKRTTSREMLPARTLGLQERGCMPWASSDLFGCCWY